MSDAEKPPGSTDELGLVKIHLVAGICWLVVGMLFGTFLGLFFIPLFFVVIRRLFHRSHATSDAA